MKKNKKSSIHKERLMMIASSVLVMAALTVTGVYLKQRSAGEEEQSYSLDFGQLGNDAEQEDGELALNQEEEKLTEAEEIDVAEADFQEVELDYDPIEEVDSNLVEIPGLTDKSGEETGEKSQSTETQQSGALSEGAGQEETEDEDSDGDGDESEDDGEENRGEEETGGEVYAMQLSFGLESGLIRPVSGEILMHYSMDGSIYFATLDQYKYNPAVYFSAQEGEAVYACADAQVISVFENEELGLAVTLDLGNGYQATYGQLKELTVSEGDYLSGGTVIGSVAQPTKYYSVEGTNLYFQLTKDGAAVNPEELF